MSKVAVVIPNHKDELNELEKISLAQCRKVLGRYPIIHVTPAGKIFSYFEPGEMVAHFPAEYFQTVKGYNRLSISPLFYEPFRDFDYILIYQLDAFVFYDALEYFCSLDYDYIGASIPKIFSTIVDGLRFRVNNSGFCLRKVAACHKLLSENADLIERHHELPDDVFFSYCGARTDIDFNVAPINVANAFAGEMKFERTVMKNGGKLPFGCHAWPKLDANFYAELFRHFGYDLRRSENKFGDGNSEFMLNRALTIVALYRLDRRIRGGKSLLRYLPTNHFAAAIVVPDGMTEKIINQLSGEEKFFCDEIINCNVDEVEKIFSELPNKELPYLFIGAVENYETHGKRVVSFRQEYMKSCEEIFHGLGRGTSDESCNFDSDNRQSEKNLPTKVAVVIPVYRELDELEKISLAQARKILGRYPIVFVAPEGKNFSCFTRKDFVAEFPAEYFRSVKTYSKLMLSPQFYETFLDFDYILIYQLDAFVFYDALEYFCSLGYDYIGAPWPFLAEVGKKFLRVGNGSFSLRNVKAHYNLLLNHADWVAQHENLNEDAILSYCGTQTDDFRVAPINVAYKFSMELNPDRCIRKNGGKLPFGCHGWSTLVEDFYVKNFWSLFFDTRTIESLQLKPEDRLSKWLRLMAIKRFNRRLQNGQSLSRYLPTKKFASIRVIRSPSALKILAQLLKEENSLTDEIFIYDAFEQINFRDVSKKNLPHLIISAENDAQLIEALERGGEHVISLQREYMKRCEDIFHHLGR